MWTYFIRSRSYFSKPPRGFTVIELLVVSLIIVIITSFLLFRQQGFNSSTLLRSLSYSVALSVRQAQVYGVSVRESGVGTNIFAQGYGVYFTNSTDCPGGVANEASYTLFSDNNNDGAYTPGQTPAERISCYRVGNGRGTDYKIKSYCAHVAGGSTQCLTGTSPVITNLTIYFRRPNPDACFSTSADTTNPLPCAPGGASTKYDYAYVQLQSFGNNTDTRTIRVDNTGQITVCKLNAYPGGAIDC